MQSKYSGNIAYLESEIKNFRKILLDEKLSGEQIADTGRQIAAAEASLHVYQTLVNAEKANNEEGEILNVLMENIWLDDTWSGRSNDVKRAMFVAALSTIQQLLRAYNIAKKNKG